MLFTVPLTLATLPDHARGCMGGDNVGEGNLVNCIKGFGVLSWMRSNEGKVTWGSGIRWGGGLW